MYIEIHMIQSFAPANLNRDDTNNPKDCEFGGVRRARISSQCIKRAIRNSPVFAQTTGVPLGVRTKRLLERLAKPIMDTGKLEAEVKDVLIPFISAFLSKLDKDGQRTAVLLYLSPGEIQRIAAMLADSWAELAHEKTRAAAVERLTKELVRKFRNRTSAPDIALFGRMLAEKPELNLDAACQVAHAISTHRVTMEMDFYTAVDDLQPEDTAGAGMMGFTGYESASFYRYARLDWEQLIRNLSDDADLARQTVKGFLRSSVDAVPTGKQNAFAAQNQPSFLLAVVRDSGAAWSLANAFEQPVRAIGDSGLVAPSVKALDNYWRCMCEAYGEKTIRAVAVLALQPDLPLAALSGHKVGNLDAWVGAVLSALPGGEASA